MKFPNYLIALSLMSTPLTAALPPLYETLAEFKSLINSQELTNHLDSGEAILAIKRKDKSFLIETNKHILEVEIIYEPTNRPGPQHFHLEFKPDLPPTFLLRL